RCGDTVVTYEELLDTVRVASGGLRRLGVRPEERVLLVLRDGLELAIAILVTPLLPPRELVAIARDARARCAVVAVDAAALIAALTEDAPDLVTLVRVGPGDGDDAAGPLWSEVLAGGG